MRSLPGLHQMRFNIQAFNFILVYFYSLLNISCSQNLKFIYLFIQPGLVEVGRRSTIWSSSRFWKEAKFDH